MSLKDTFEVTGSLLVQRVVPKGESFGYYICWQPHVSCYANTSQDVIQFARWPASTPTGAALRHWLKASPEPVIEEPNDSTKTII